MSLPVLNEYELRVLGSLVEKQISTPDYYPITLNALTNACNQKNHRDPVVSYTDGDVERALATLRDKHLAYLFDGAVSRVPKYGHFLPTTLALDPPEVAVMTVLMLRGPQTPGELRSRSAHLHEFETLPAVEEVLSRLSTRAEPLVRKLARRPGTKEARYAQLLGGEINFEEGPADSSPASTGIAPLPSAPASVDRVATLTTEVEGLRQELSNLKAEFAEFKKRFE